MNSMNILLNSKWMTLSSSFFFTIFRIEKFPKSHWKWCGWCFVSFHRLIFIWISIPIINRKGQSTGQSLLNRNHYVEKRGKTIVFCAGGFGSQSSNVTRIQIRYMISMKNFDFKMRMKLKISRQLACYNIRFKAILPVFL